MEFYVLTRWFNCSKPSEQFEMSMLHDVADSDAAWDIIEEEIEDCRNQTWLMSKEEVEALEQTIQSAKLLPGALL